MQPLIDDLKSKSGRPTKAIDSFLLYGLLLCGLCGTRLATSYGTKRKDASSLRIYLCNHQKMNMRRLKSRGIEKCNLPRVDAETIEKGVWNYLRTFFFYMDEKVEGAVEDKWKPKLEQAEQKVENIRKEKKRLEIGLANTESLRFEKEFPKVRYLRQVAELTQQLSQIDWELKEAKNELLEIKEMISNEQSVIEFASGNPDIFEQILQCIETLPFSGKQKLLKGMLVEPIKVFSSTAYMPVFSFNQLILQEILSEYCPNINSKHRFQGPCAFA